MDPEQNITTNEAFVRSLNLQPIRVTNNLFQNSITDTRNRILDTINNGTTNTETAVVENNDAALQSTAIPNRLVDRNTNANEVADSTRTPAQRAAFVQQYRRIRVSNVSQSANGDMIFTSVIPASFITKNPTTGVLQLNGNLTTVANTSNVANYNLRNTRLTELPDGTFNLSQTFSPKKSDTSFRQRYYLQSDFGNNYSNRGAGVMLSLNFSGGRTSINLGPVYNQFSAGVSLTRDTTNMLPVARPLTAVDIEQSIKLTDNSTQAATVASNNNLTNQNNTVDNTANTRPSTPSLK
jgi:hypothetical protein